MAIVRLSPKIAAKTVENEYVAEKGAAVMICLTILWAVSLPTKHWYTERKGSSIISEYRDKNFTARHVLP